MPLEQLVNPCKYLIEIHYRLSEGLQRPSQGFFVKVERAVCRLIVVGSRPDVHPEYRLPCRAKPAATASSGPTRGRSSNAAGGRL